jgi:hypothetical protein
MRRHLLIVLMAVCASAMAAEPTGRPATTKPASPWGVRPALVADPKLPHVLLVGDSILNGYNSHAAELLRGQVNLDVWVTPVALGPGATKEMTTLLTKHAYDVILFNDIGLHAWQPGRIPEGQYEPLIRVHLAALRKLAPKAKLIFATTTPMTTKIKPIALDAEFNPVIAQRNQIAVKVMAENQIPVADFYGLLVDKVELAAGDRFHWTKPAYQLIGRQAAEKIAKALDLQLPATLPAPADKR